ncbi:MAG: hypothetical protein EAZ42_02790 [Verrucomicrobia bacterium]|nr:MAG: hypothetical protein EAZ42_02790 [Verrucomicrobiota bacterium]
MKALNPQFFAFTGFASNSSPVIKAIHYYDYSSGFPLEIPNAELGGIRKSWPSCISPFHSHEPFALHEDVVQFIGQNSLTGLAFEPIKISKLNRKSKFEKTTPQYYLAKATVTMPTTIEVYQIEIASGGQLRYVFLFSANDHDDARIVEIRGRNDWGQHAYRYIVPDESPVHDFFNINKPSSFGEIHCSRKFVEIARETQWDHLYFHPLDSLSVAKDEFRRLPWPPENWYPEGQKALYL